MTGRGAGQRHGSPLAGPAHPSGATARGPDAFRSAPTVYRGCTPGVPPLPEKSSARRPLHGRPRHPVAQPREAARAPPARGRQEPARRFGARTGGPSVAPGTTATGRVTAPGPVASRFRDCTAQGCAEHGRLRLQRAKGRVRTAAPLRLRYRFHGVFKVAVLQVVRRTQGFGASPCLRGTARRT